MDMYRQVNGIGSPALMSPLYNQKYVLVGASGNNDVALWNVVTRKIEKRFERYDSSGYVKCAMIPLDKQYIVGADEGMKGCIA
jgi:hypothetical protein